MLAKNWLRTWGAGCGQVHDTGAWKIVECPKCRAWEDYAGFTGKISARRGSWVAGFVVEKDLALPIVRLDTENRIGEDQNRNWWLVPFHGEPA